MTTTIRTDATGTFGALQIGNADSLRFGSDTSGQLSGFRNIIINGDFRIWQRGTTGSAPLGQYTYTADRWAVDPYGAAVTWSGGASTGGPSAGTYNSIVLTGATGNTGSGIRQRIEAMNCRGLRYQKMTLSYYVYGNASVNATVTPSLLYATAADNFSSMGLIEQASSSNVVNATWTKYSYTFAALPTQVLNGLCLTFAVSALGAGQSVGIADVQLEVGSISTKFEYRPYGLELSLCQRYYETGYEPYFYMGIVSSMTAAYGEVRYTVLKRTAPTVTMTGWKYWSNGADTPFTPSLDISYPELFRFNAAGLTAWNGWDGLGTWTASAEL